MKKFFTLISVLFIAVISTSAQSKNDWFVGGQLSNTSLQDLSIAPMVSYQIDSSWQVGLTANWTNFRGSYDYTAVAVKYYPTNWSLKNDNNNSVRAYMSLNGSTSFEGESYQFGTAVGLTAILKNWFIEPRLGLTYSAWSGDDSAALNTTINFGLRF